MTGHEKVVRNVTVLGAISNLILNVILVPLYGMHGAATATSTSSVIASMAALYAMYHTLSITAIPRRILKR